MEEVIVLVLQWIIEVLFEIATYFPFDLIGHSRDSGAKTTFGGWVFAYAIIGIAIGVTINWIHPQIFLQSSVFRIANIIIAPFLSGYLSYRLSKWRSLKNPEIKPGRHFFFAAAFTLGIVFVRFFYGTR